MSIFSKLADNIFNKTVATTDVILSEKNIRKTGDFDKLKKSLPWVDKPVARTRQDIAKWNNAINFFYSEEPKNWVIQLLLKEICNDAVLTSQLQNRLQQVLSNPFVINNEKGDVDEEQTQKLKNNPEIYKIITAIWEQIFYGYNLLELQAINDNIKATNLPRANVVPQLGLFYPDYSEDKNIAYREMKEFGQWILEFNTGDIGLINKAVPHVLFKRFAQSCWSELCEIYGIPPRVMKTNTQSRDALNRAEQMMRDMSAAAWFIIDTNETFEWAKAADTNGDVYKNLITLCNNEISLLITGAVIGQDTQHGSNAKEQSSMGITEQLVKSDLTLISQQFNSIVIPALLQLGFIKGNVNFRYDTVDDLDKLWSITKEALPFFEIDPEWIKSKFGLPILGAKNKVPDANKLSENFFD